MSAQQAQLDPLMFLDVDQDPLGFLNDPFNARDWSRSGVNPPAAPQNTREQQSVMTSLLATAVDEERQPTTTFTAQHFPDSYSSYLAGGPHPKTEGLFTSNVDADSSTAALEAKQARVREKNRRAMKKFREKQKEKTKESESRLQELEQQVQSLQLHNDKLQSEVQTLKLAKFAATRSSSGDEATQARMASASSGGQQGSEEPNDSPEEWEPRYGWTDFDPQATMVLHLGLQDSPNPTRLTQHQLRTMTHPQFLLLFRAFNSRILNWIEHANDDLSSPAAQQLYALKYEVSALAANLSMNNPELYHKKWGPTDPALAKEHGNWSPQEPQTPVSAPIPEDIKRACIQLLNVLRISPEQRATMIKVLEMVKADIKRLKAERSSILLSLVEKHNVEEPTLEPRQFSGILSDLRRLTHNAEDIHRAHCIYASTMWSGVLNPIQAGKLCLCCQPNAPNIYMLGAAAAESAADTGDLEAEEVQGIVAQVESRYRAVWNQHSSIIKEGQMGSMPIILVNDFPNIGGESSRNLVSSGNRRVPGFNLQ